MIWSKRWNRMYILLCMAVNGRVLGVQMQRVRIPSAATGRRGAAQALRSQRAAAGARRALRVEGLRQRERAARQGRLQEEQASPPSLKQNIRGSRSEQLEMISDIVSGRFPATNAAPLSFKSPTSTRTPRPCTAPGISPSGSSLGRQQ